MPAIRVPLPPMAGWRAAGSVAGVSVGSPIRLRTGPATSPSQAAGVRCELLTAAFTDSLSRYVQATRSGFVATVTSVAMELHGRIARRTPVDTGRARNSWHVLLPGATSDSYAYTDRTGRGFAGGLASVSLGELEAGVGTNVEYMLPLEAGWSRQAPAGMVAVSVLEMKSALDRKVADVIASVGGMS